MARYRWGDVGARTGACFAACSEYMDGWSSDDDFTRVLGTAARRATCNGEIYIRLVTAELQSQPRTTNEEPRTFLEPSMSAPTDISLLSPNRRVEVRFALGDWCADGKKRPHAPLWQVWLDGRQMLRNSRAGMFPSFVGREAAFTDRRQNKVPDKAAVGFEAARVVRHRIRRVGQPDFGDAAELYDHANELVVRLREIAAPGRRIDLVFRCANEGAAVRVRVPRQRGFAQVVPVGEGMVFRFPEGTLGWFAVGEAPAATARFCKMAVDEMTTVCGTPLTLNYVHGKLACLLQVGDEALRLQPTRDGLSACGHVEPARSKTPYESPWQVLLVADSPCNLPQDSGFLASLGARGVRIPVPGDAAGNCTLPFVQYPLWLAGTAGGSTAPHVGTFARNVSTETQPRPPTAALEHDSTPAHRAAFALVCGAGAACWDETRFLRGEIGEFVVVARRLGDVWQVAGITGADGRVLSVRLEDFLHDRTNQTYRLTILRDPLPGESAADGMVQETFDGVDAFDKPRLQLLPRGGFVLQLERS